MNVIACQLETGETCWYIIGCYLALGDSVTIRDVETAVKERLRRKELIVAGCLDTNLERTRRRDLDAEILEVVAMEGLEYILGHLLPQRFTWCKDRQTWAMVQQGREVRSRMDYILGYDRRIFRNVAVRYLRHNSDHFLVMGCLHGAPQGSTHATSGGRCVSLSDCQDVRQGRGWTRCFPIFVAPCQSRMKGRCTTTRGYRRRCGDSLMRESPQGGERAVPDKGKTDGKSNLGGIEGRQAKACGEDR